MISYHEDERGLRGSVFQEWCVRRGHVSGACTARLGVGACGMEIVQSLVT